MDNEILEQLNSLLEIVRVHLEEFQGSFDKFQIALTGTLRLMDGKSAALETLHGNKENLASYIIQQTTDLKNKSREQLEDILEHLTKAISMVSDDDRNS